MNQRTSFQLFIFLICVCLTAAVQGQKEDYLPSSLFMASTTGKDVEGYFHHLDGTGLYYAFTLQDLRDPSTLHHLPLTSLHTIGLRRQGSKGKGIAIGMAAGALSAIMLGNLMGKREEDCGHTFLSFGPCSKQETTQVLAVPLALLGAGIGALFGSQKKQFIIRGKKKRLQAQEAAIRKYAFRQ